MKLSDFMPQQVIASLTPEQHEEAKAALGDEKKTVGSLADQMKSPTNPALLYLILDTPFKYTLLHHGSFTEGALLELVDYGSKNLDSFHRRFYAHDQIQGQWEQKFDVVAAALGHKALSALSADRLIQDVINTEPTDATAAEIAEIIGYQLLDKWSPKEFNKDVLQVLVKLFEEHGSVDYLPSFKRWARRVR